MLWSAPWLGTMDAIMGHHEVIMEPLESFPLKGLSIAVEQPPDDIETITTDGVFVKAMVVKRAGTLIPQHSHIWDHSSYVARGAVRVWRDGVLGEVVQEFHSIHIKAGVKHTFQALEDNTVVLCIHNLHSADKVAIMEEHQLDLSILKDD